MQMKAGEAIANQKRHDESWLELVGLLHDTGISDYSIFLEKETHRLFAILRCTIDHKMDALPQHQGDAAFVEIHGRYYGDQFGRFASGYSVATHVSTRGFKGLGRTAPLFRRVSLLGIALMAEDKVFAGSADVATDAATHSGSPDARPAQRLWDWSAPCPADCISHRTNPHFLGHNRILA